MFFRRPLKQPVSAATHLELVRSLLDTMVTTVLMGLLFVVLAHTCSRHDDQPALTVIGIVGSILALVRVGLLLLLRAIVARRGLDLSSARWVERTFAVAYLCFAAVLGAFAFEAMVDSSLEDQTAVIAMVVGYAAGVAVSVSLRPWIAIPATLLSVLPTIAGSLMLRDTGHRMLGFVLTVLLAGGIVSVIKRFRDAVDMIEMRQRFASLARLDPLTGLANRLALEDGFLRAVEGDGGRDVVLHCFDLDHFKPVNDTYGHVIGDLLLQAVSGRLQRLLRAGDLAVRLGGDEFAVMQTGVAHPDEGELMARRIARALGEPYMIQGCEITVGASVGSSSGRDHGPDLARLLGVADDALYEVKRKRPARRALAS